MRVAAETAKELLAAAMEETGFRPRLLHLVGPELLNRRAPVDLNGMVRDPGRIAQATGVVDALDYRAERRRALEMDLLDTVDPVVRAALQKRIRDLRITDGTFG